MNSVGIPQQASPEHRSVTRRSSGVSQSQRMFIKIGLVMLSMNTVYFHFLQLHHEVHHHHPEHSIAHTPVIDRLVLFPRKLLAFHDLWQIHGKRVQLGENI